MTILPDSSPTVTGLQTRLVVETLVQVVPGTEIVAIVLLLLLFKRRGWLGSGPMA